MRGLLFLFELLAFRQWIFKLSSPRSYLPGRHASLLYVDLTRQLCPQSLSAAESDPAFFRAVE